MMAVCPRARMVQLTPPEALRVIARLHDGARRRLHRRREGGESPRHGAAGVLQVEAADSRARARRAHPFGGIGVLHALAR